MLRRASGMTLCCQGSGETTLRGVALERPRKEVLDTARAFKEGNNLD